MLALSRLLLMLFSLAAFDASLLRGGEPAARLAESEEVVERFSIRKDCGWILLPVEIKGDRYHFVLDTGAGCSSYDEPLWPLLGKMVAWEKDGLKKDLPVPFFRPPDARLGKLWLPKDYLVPGIDLTEFRQTLGEEVHGILGMDFLKDQMFRVDFDRGEIVFLRAVGPDPGQQLAVRLEKNRPQVQVELPGLKEPEWFLLDTGCARHGGTSGGRLSEAAFEALSQSGKLASSRKAPFLGVTGVKLARFGWLDSFPLAGNTHKYLCFGEGRTSLLGLDVLSRYVVTFDFPHEAIYLKKGGQFDRPIRYDHSGLELRRVKGETVVERVEDGSAADRAGIRRRDVLLQIDKEPVSGMTLFALRDRLCEQGKKICLTVRSGRKQLDLRLVLSSDK